MVCGLMTCATNVAHGGLGEGRPGLPFGGRGAGSKNREVSLFSLQMAHLKPQK